MLQLTTTVDIAPSTWQIAPCERMLFVGSCFADEMGRRFKERQFHTLVNPFGVMYNPISIGHTTDRLLAEGATPFERDKEGTAVLTLGTNHVYILKETGHVVDNCRKRPQALFEERELSVAECTEALLQAIHNIHNHFPRVRFVITVSPIRYRKYGYHGSRLSKATLLLAVDETLKAIAKGNTDGSNDCFQVMSEGKDADAYPLRAAYFPAYEIMNDELRDYRFYRPDMLHPTEQAVDYIYERFAQAYFSPQTTAFLKEWQPLHAALNHKPFDADSEEYKRFLDQTWQKIEVLRQRYPDLAVRRT